MPWIRISKYHPRFRDGNGAYIRHDWTSVSDIGRIFDDQVLDEKTYLTVEDSYIFAIRSILGLCGIESMEVKAIEHSPPSNITNRLPLSNKKKPSEYHNGQFVSGVDLETLLRLCLREDMWCTLIYRKTFEMSIGYDYYIDMKVANRFISKLDRLELPNGIYLEKTENLKR